MIRLLSARQIKEWDNYTIQHEPIASIDLMERACAAFVSWFTARFDATRKVGIVCGTGNNGGDGLGIARLLHDWGYPVSVWVVRADVQQTVDFSTNFARLKGKVAVNEVSAPPEKGIFQGLDILVDGIFGSGLSRPVEGLYAGVIEAMNAAAVTRVAIDIPSGLQADAPSGTVMVRADYTVTFEIPKLAFLLPDHGAAAGEWTAVPIGLDRRYLQDADARSFLVERKDARKILHRRSRFDHKGTFGRALLVAGSEGKMGAAVLAAGAALRGGVGLLTVYVPRAGYTILQTAVPEAMVELSPETTAISTFPAQPESFQAIGVGPGLGTAAATARALGDFLQAVDKPMVLDADALNILSANKGWLERIPPGSILTPHPGEFRRLVGDWADDHEKLDRLRYIASQHDVTVVLKGGYTAVATPEGKVYFNSTGNPGMATGGSGDVLTGLLTALLAQGYPSEQAALLGVYVHGLAGDLGVQETSQEGLIASDIIRFLPQAFRRLS